MVVIHGALDRSAGMLRLARRLSLDAQVIRYDRRGYGRSMSHPGPFTLSDHVSDLGEIVRRHSAARGITLFGHSYGGHIALAALERYSEVIDGVVVYEPPLSWMPWWPTDTPGGTGLRHADRPGDAAEHFIRRLIGDDKWNALSDRVREARRAEGRPMVAELAELRRGPPWDLSATATPVVALVGEHSSWAHRRAGKELGGLIRGVMVEEIAGARHFGPNSHPDVVAGWIRQQMRS